MLLKISNFLADNSVEDSEVSFMNSIQTHAGLSANVAVKPESTETRAKLNEQINTAQVENDRVSKLAANDMIVAKVLSFSMAKAMQTQGSDALSSSDLSNIARDSADAGPNVNSAHKGETSISETRRKMFSDSISAPSSVFSVDEVSSNVSTFVSKALAKLASSGHNEQQLGFFRDEAIKGVMVGVDQAKLELSASFCPDRFQQYLQWKQGSYWWSLTQRREVVSLQHWCSTFS